MSDAVKPVAEDPKVVTGGPLDPTSPEGTPPEGAVSGAADPALGGPSPSAPPPAPLYQGLTGSIDSVEQLKAYAKQVEDMFVQAKAAQGLQPQLAPNPAATPPLPSAKERFAETIYAKPEEAFEIAVQEATSRIQEKNDKERQRVEFWDRFYEKHHDLKRLQRVVQSVVKERASEIALIKTEAEVSEYISRETRNLVNLVKKETGGIEVVVPSGRVASLGGSGEPAPQPPVKAQAPLTFAEQIRAMNRKRANK